MPQTWVKKRGMSFSSQGCDEFSQTKSSGSGAEPVCPQRADLWMLGFASKQIPAFCQGVTQTDVVLGQICVLPA